MAAGLVLLAGRGAEAAGRAQAMIADLARTPPFLPTGRDVIALGVPAGPRIGQVLAAARSTWIDGGAPSDEAAQSRFLEEALRSSASGRGAD